MLLLLLLLWMVLFLYAGECRLYCELIVNVCVNSHYVWVMRMCEHLSSSWCDVSDAVILFHNLDFCSASEGMKWQKWWHAKNGMKFVYVVYEIPFDLLSNQWSIHCIYAYCWESLCVRVKLSEENSSVSDKNNCLKNRLSIGIWKFRTVIDSNENWQLSECVCVYVRDVWGGDNRIFVAKPLLLFCWNKISFCRWVW